MSKVCLPEKFKIVDGCTKVTTNGGVTCDYISLKNAARVTIVAKLRQAVSHATALGVTEATNVAAGSAAAISAVMPSWKNADVSSSDTLVRTTTDAASVAATAATTQQILILQVDPAILSDGFDCIAATLSDSSQATNWADVTYYIEERYQEDVPPAAITN